jgi:hypothetical protein
MDIFQCIQCKTDKPLNEFFKDNSSNNGLKKKCKQCVKESRQEFKIQIIVPDTIVCKECNTEKPNSDFDVDNTVKIGRKRTCKECISVREKKRNSTWQGLVRKKVVYSWTTHQNNKQENKLEISEGMQLLEEQNFLCAHCQHQLSNEQGTRLKRNCWVASLDRIDTDIVGYGSGNAQWLCMSCNNGKNTMSNEDHLNKYKFRDDRIKELENEVLNLRKTIQDMEEAQRLNERGC